MLKPMPHLFPAAKAFLPIHWHNSAWYPRVVIRRRPRHPHFSSLRRCAPNAPTPRFVLLHAQPIHDHAATAPRVRASVLPRLFVFSRLPIFPGSRLAKLASL
jgi:hypothetical protein